MNNDWLILISFAGCIGLICGIIGLMHGYEQGCSDTRKWLVDRERARRALP